MLKQWALTAVSTYTDVLAQSRVLPGSRRVLRWHPGTMQCQSCQHENPEALGFCERCGGELGATVAQGERRQLTVLVADLANSRELSEQLGGEDYRDLIDAYQTASVSAVTRRGGHVAQY